MKRSQNFFLFEQLPDARDWSNAECVLLLRCVLTGKAQEVFTALSLEQAGSYNLVKNAVFKAYELVPEEILSVFLVGEERQTDTL